MWWSSSSDARSNLERLIGGITPKPPSLSLKAYSHVFNYTFYTIELLSLKNNISFIQKKKIFMELSVVFFLHVETSDSKSCIESDTI